MNNLFRNLNNFQTQYISENIASISAQLDIIINDGLKIQDSPYEIATAFGTLGAVVVALFAVFWPSILKHWNRPKLVFEFNNKEPFCRHTVGLLNLSTGETEKRNSYHIRLRIKNKGKSIARRCEGKLIAIAYKDLQNLRKDFDPVVLHWVGSDDVIKNFGMGQDKDKGSIQIIKNSTLDVNSKEYEYLDFLSTNEIIDKLQIEAIDKEMPRGIVVDPERNKYYFLVTVYAENADPISEIYKTDIGKKYDDVFLKVANKSEKDKFYRLLD